MKNAINDNFITTDIHSNKWINSFHLDQPDHVVYLRLLDTTVQYKSHLNCITVIMLMSYECWVFSWSLLLLKNIVNRKPSKFKFLMASPSPKIDTSQIFDSMKGFERRTINMSTWWTELDEWAGWRSGHDERSTNSVNSRMVLGSVARVSARLKIV